MTDAALLPPFKETRVWGALWEPRMRKSQKVDHPPEVRFPAKLSNGNISNLFELTFPSTGAR